MKIIIYGKGKLFQRYMEMIDWMPVVAIADKKVDEQKEIKGKKIIHPSVIAKIEYDFLVIFSKEYFYDIRRELIGEYSVPADKILAWSFLTGQDNEWEVFQTIRKFIVELKIDSMLDIGMSVIPKVTFTKEEVIEKQKFLLDGLGEVAFPFYTKIYDTVYLEDDIITKRYDLIYVEGVEKLRYIVKNSGLVMLADMLLIRISYVDYLPERMQEVQVLLDGLGKVKKMFLMDGVYLMVDTKKEKLIEVDTKVYVVTHREYNLLNDSLYCPICVGEKYRNPSFFSELDGTNIGYLNGKINECTALYWIWKNTSSQYVGLNHYRRYFYNYEILSEGNYLDKDNIFEILQKYDLILPKRVLLYDMTVKEQIRRSVGNEVFEKGYDIVCNAIRKHQPDYVDAYNEVMNGHKIFLCNMFVTRREILNEYCEWLFSFLIEASENIDVSNYDTYSRRIIGFFAERMMTVWLLKHDFEIKELPFDIVG